MTTTAPPLTAAPQVSAAQAAISDTLTITWRNLTRLFRVPDSIAFGIVQNVMFVLLFTYVFGGAIQVPGGSYVEFLMAGIFVQTVAFTCATTTISMAEDLQRGIIDRFRSLPMAKGAVLAGRTVSDFIFSTITVTALVLTGLLVGWRTHALFLPIVAGFALLALFAYAFLWIGAVIGMSVRSPRSPRPPGSSGCSADVHLQRLRPGAVHAVVVAADRGVEPDPVCGPSTARTVRNLPRLQPR